MEDIAKGKTYPNSKEAFLDPAYPGSGLKKNKRKSFNRTPMQRLPLGRISSSRASVSFFETDFSENEFTPRTNIAAFLKEAKSTSPKRVLRSGNVYEDELPEPTVSKRDNANISSPTITPRTNLLVNIFPFGRNETPVVRESDVSKSGAPPQATTHDSRYGQVVQLSWLDERKKAKERSISDEETPIDKKYQHTRRRKIRDSLPSNASPTPEFKRPAKGNALKSRKKDANSSLSSASSLDDEPSYHAVKRRKIASPISPISAGKTDIKPERSSHKKANTSISSTSSFEESYHAVIRRKIASPYLVAEDKAIAAQNKSTPSKSISRGNSKLDINEDKEPSTQTQSSGKPQEKDPFGFDSGNDELSETNANTRTIENLSRRSISKSRRHSNASAATSQTIAEIHDSPSNKSTKKLKASVSQIDVVTSQSDRFIDSSRNFLTNQESPNQSNNLSIWEERPRSSTPSTRSKSFLHSTKHENYEKIAQQIMFSPNISPIRADKTASTFLAEDMVASNEERFDSDDLVQKNATTRSSRSRILNASKTGTSREKIQEEISSNNHETELLSQLSRNDTVISTKDDERNKSTKQNSLKVTEGMEIPQTEESYEDRAELQSISSKNSTIISRKDETLSKSNRRQRLEQYENTESEETDHTAIASSGLQNLSRNESGKRPKRKSTSNASIEQDSDILETERNGANVNSPQKNTETNNLRSRSKKKTLISSNSRDDSVNLLPQSADKSRRKSVSNSRSEKSIGNSFRKPSEAEDLDPRFDESISKNTTVVAASETSEDINGEELYSLLYTPRFDMNKKPKYVSGKKSKNSDTENTKPTETNTKKKPPAKALKSRRAKTDEAKNLPRSTIKWHCERLTKMKFSTDALDQIEKVSEVFWVNTFKALETFALHAKRKTIDVSDIVLMMKTQKLIKDTKDLYPLIEDYLPPELQAGLLPIVHLIYKPTSDT